ncbi:MAG: leucine-rich repeat domain-containing protein, partial [Clostridia bacterium]|nr:leucine-rich repeat domain-containing protein [Clostridia bacterium]
MKNTVRYILLTVFCTVLFFAALSFSCSAAEIIDEGFITHTLRWKIDNEGTLYLEGSGNTNNYTEIQGNGSAPWNYNYSDFIKKAVIGSGINYLGENSFRKCTALETVILPQSLTYIGDYAFYDCPSLTEVILPTTLENLGDGAFYNCTKLKNIGVFNSLKKLGTYAFYNCTSLKSIEFSDTVTAEISTYAFGSCNSLVSVK